MTTLYEKISQRVPKIADGLMEKYRVACLARAPDYAKCLYEGPGWETKRKDRELRFKFETEAWNMAFCEIIQVLMDSDVDLEKRIAELERTK